MLGFDLLKSGIFSVLPWMTMAVTSNLGGWIADTLVTRGVSVTRVRKIMQSVRPGKATSKPLWKSDLGGFSYLCIVALRRTPCTVVRRSRRKGRDTVTALLEGVSRASKCSRWTFCSTL